MAEKLKVWFDSEGDFLELCFSDAPGHIRETDFDAAFLTHGKIRSVG